ncbi:MAG TPA: Npt1/Npt2 family nucleotide transporter [Steroidobacteraceae bacterium]|nr:Npt1/Npt2 family nucleotide transporter [Steroidobacteraceae bacterium]
MNNANDASGFERFLSLFTRVQPGEGRCIAVLCLQACALMAAYYLIRPVREALILTQGGAELRSYAVGLQAALLIAIIPAYSTLIRRVDTSKVFQYVNAFFAVNLVILSLAGLAGFRLGFLFFIWASIFGVMTVTQFWAFATDVLSVDSGQRLFGIIAVGVSCGAWMGARLSQASIEILGPYGLMLASAATLMGSIWVSRWARASVPVASRSVPQADARATKDVRDSATRWLGGFAVIGRSRYLLCIAALVVVLNWITSTGEYVMSSWLLDIAHQQAAESPAVFIGKFMGRYCSAITLVGLLVQLLLVSRIILVAGLPRALMITPLAFLAGYLLIGVFPVFAVVQAVLVAQRSLDYSLLNTTRGALLLPASREVKYQAKTAFDTFFYRFGDLLSTVSVFAGTRLLHHPRMQFIWLILILSATLTLLAWLIGREYQRNFPRRSAPSLTAPVGGPATGVVALQQ